MASSTCEPQKETKEHSVLSIYLCLWHKESWDDVGHEEACIPRWVELYAVSIMLPLELSEPFLVHFPV